LSKAQSDSIVIASCLSVRSSFCNIVVLWSYWMGYLRRNWFLICTVEFCVMYVTLCAAQVVFS